MPWTCITSFSTGSFFTRHSIRIFVFSGNLAWTVTLQDQIRDKVDETRYRAGGLIPKNDPYTLLISPNFDISLTKSEDSRMFLDVSPCEVRWSADKRWILQIHGLTDYFAHCIPNVSVEISWWGETGGQIDELGRFVNSKDFRWNRGSESKPISLFCY